MVGEHITGLGFSGKATVARSHHLLHGDEKDATGGRDTDAGFLSVSPTSLNWKVISRECVDGDPVLVGHKDSRLFFDLVLDHRDFLTETAGEGEGGE